MEFIQIVWIALIVIFIAVEVATIGITSVWFAVGSVVALIASFLGAQFWLQFVLFILVAVVAIVLTRPLAKKYINARVQPTNSDMIIGTQAVVTERVNNIAATGAAKVGGRIWTARSETGYPIEPGALATVVAIEGVKVILSQR